MQSIPVPSSHVVVPEGVTPGRFTPHSLVVHAADAPVAYGRVHERVKSYARIGLIRTVRGTGSLAVDRVFEDNVQCRGYLSGPRSWPAQR